MATMEMDLGSVNLGFYLVLFWIIFSPLLVASSFQL